MAESLRSSEFGNWLVCEISKNRRESKSADADLAQSASSKLETLNVARQVLVDFLKIQQKMLDAASAARRKAHDAARLEAVTRTSSLSSLRLCASERTHASTQMQDTRSA